MGRRTIGFIRIATLLSYGRSFSFRRAKRPASLLTRFLKSNIRNNSRYERAGDVCGVTKCGLGQFREGPRETFQCRYRCNEREHRAPGLGCLCTHKVRPPVHDHDLQEVFQPGVQDRLPCCTVHPQTTPVPHRSSSSREVSGPCLNVTATRRGSGASAIRRIAHGCSVIPRVGRCPARPHGGGLHLSGVRELS
jgi:hypothetical protein